jgi:hypothetical protein
VVWKTERETESDREQTALRTAAGIMHGCVHNIRTYMVAHEMELSVMRVRRSKKKDELFFVFIRILDKLGI